jgi:hypothetical protein
LTRIRALHEEVAQCIHEIAIMADDRRLNDLRFASRTQAAVNAT